MEKVLSIFLDIALVAMAFVTLIAGTMYDTVGLYTDAMSGYIDSNSVESSE